MKKKPNFIGKLNKREIFLLLDEARYYHNYSCEEDKAMKICDKILEIYPNNRDAMLIKAGSLGSLDKEKESFELITKIINKWPNHWEAHYLLGLALFNINEKKALRYLKKSISLKKTFDNTITAAQLTHFLEDNDYKKYLEYAKDIDSSRYKKYMKNYWEWEIY